MPFFVPFFVTAEGRRKDFSPLEKTESAGGKIFLLAEIDSRALYEVIFIATFDGRERREPAKVKWPNHGSILHVGSVGFFTIEP